MIETQTFYKNVSEYKTSIFLKSDAKIFVESDDLLARRIAIRSKGKAVVCPDSGKIYYAKEYDYEKMSKEGYECDCVAAGFCPLLQKEMTEPLHHLCQTSEKHRTVLRTAKKRGVHDNDVKKRYARKTRQRTDLENTAEEAIKEMKAAGVDIDKQFERSW